MRVDRIGSHTPYAREVIRRSYEEAKRLWALGKEADDIALAEGAIAAKNRWSELRQIALKNKKARTSNGESALRPEINQGMATAHVAYERAIELSKKANREM